MGHRRPLQPKSERAGSGVLLVPPTPLVRGAVVGAGVLGAQVEVGHRESDERRPSWARKNRKGRRAPKAIQDPEGRADHHCDNQPHGR